MEISTASTAHPEREHLSYVPGSDFPPLMSVQGCSARNYAEKRLLIPELREVVDGWRVNYQEPFIGLTYDGTVRENVYDVGPIRPYEAAPTEQIRAAVTGLREATTADQWDALTYPLASSQWRAWSNPEVLIFDNGLRLEEVDPLLRGLMLAVAEASLSERGYRTVTTLMRLNAYLGDLVGLPAIMNEFSYHFALYGDPFGTQPWGWQLYGHHIAINVLIAGDRMTIGPTFLGAEPDAAANGRDAGVRVLMPRETLGLEFIRSLDPGQLTKAQEYDQIEHPDIPTARIDPADGRHLAGAFNDNRVIPLQGIAGSDLTEEQREKLIAICDEYSSLLPHGPRAARRREIERWTDETHLTWIGGIGDEDAFYYRVQSPVILAEFDHHQGMWLTNPHPARFHTHTTLRLPNANDYGRLLWPR